VTLAVVRDPFQTDTLAARALVRVQDRQGVWRRLPDVLRLEWDRSVEQQAATLRVEVANPDGWYTPDQLPEKFPYLDLRPSPWQTLLFPGAPIRAYLGYGDDVPLVFTGHVDRVAINAGTQTLTLECRDTVGVLMDHIVSVPYEYENWVASDIMADLVTKAGLTAVFEDSVVADATSVLFHHDFEGVDDIPPEYVMDGAGWELEKGPGYGVVRSRTTAAGQTAGISIQVTLNRPGFVQFDYQVRANRLHLFIDGEKKAIYYPGGWRVAQWQLGTGDHTIRWVAEDVGETGPIGRAVAIDDIIVAEYTGGLDPYVVPFFQAEIGQTLWDEIMRLAETVGYWIRALPDGTIYGSLWPKVTQTDPPKWQLTEYRDLTDASYTLDGSWVRNKIWVSSEHGTSVFWNQYLLNTVSRGRVRVAYVDVPWATSHPRRQVVAEHLFRQMLRKFRTVQVITPGNPRHMVGDLVQLRERVTTAAAKYQVIGARTTFDVRDGYVDTLDLEYGV